MPLTRSLQDREYGKFTQGGDNSPAISVADSPFALRTLTVGDVTYIGKAAIGSLVTDPVWQIKKLDKSSGLAITWADGDSNFNNIFDSCTELEYA